MFFKTVSTITTENLNKFTTVKFTGMEGLAQKYRGAPSYLLPTIFLAGVFLQHTISPIGIWVFFPKIPLKVLLCFPIIWENWSQLILLT